jgi:hypothetical protein
LRNARGSPRFCAECYLQERTQHIQHWREAGTPDVGIFYVIAGELRLESTPLPEARHLCEVIIHFRTHRRYWNRFSQASLAFYGLPSPCYLRGRVAFVKAPARYHLELGPEFVTDAAIVRQVMEAMHLPAAQTEVRLAPHFRTSKFPL